MALGLGGRVGAQEESGPLLASITISPATVDVTNAPTLVILRCRISSAVGFSHGYISTSSPALDVYLNTSDRLSGDDFDGLYEVTLDIPRFLRTGRFDLLCQLYDNDSNRTNYGGQGLPYPDGVNGWIEVVNAGLVDLTAPELVSASVDRSSVDVTETRQRVVLDLRITDDLAGVEDFGVVLEEMATGTPKWRKSYYFDSESFVEGTANDARYRFAVWLEPGLPPGEARWVISIGDKVNNTRRLEPTDLKLAIVNTGAAESLDQWGYGQGPQLVSLSVDQSAIDLTSGDGELAGTLRFKDEGTGLRRIYLNAKLESPEGDPQLFGHEGLWLDLSPKDITAGHRGEGEIRFSIPVPETSAPGTWQLGVDLEDRAGNWSWYSNDEWSEPLPGPHQGDFVVRGSHPRPNGDEGEPPLPFELVSVVSRGEAVDVSSQDVTMVFDLAILDPGDQFESTSIYLAEARNPYSPRVYSSGATRVRRRGDTTHFTVPVTIPRYSRPGRWLVRCGADGRLGGYWDYDDDELPAGSTRSVTVVNTGVIDILPPRLGLSLESTVIDLSKGPANLNATLEFSDLSGLVSTEILLIHLDTEQGVYFDSEFDLTALLSGTPQAGTVKATLAIPWDTPSGNYIVRLGGTDRVGNAGSLGETNDLYSPSSVLAPGSDEFVTITQGSGNPLVRFLAQFPELPASASGPDHDFDGDGLPHLVELLFDDSPTATDWLDHHGRWYSEGVESRAVGLVDGRLEFRFPVHPRWYGPDADPALTFTGEYSPNGAAWTSVAPESLGGGRFRIRSPDGAPSSALLRVRASLAAPAGAAMDEQPAQTQP